MARDPRRAAGGRGQEKVGEILSLWSKLKPAFWDQPEDPRTQLMNYRRLWKVTWGAAVAVSVLPVVILALINFYQFEVQYRLQRADITSQVHRLISNTRVQISYFLEERRAALAFIVRENSYQDLNEPLRLSRIFMNLKGAFGGFVDLGVIDHAGLQSAYIGPYTLQGRNYADQDWYKEVALRGLHISDVFLGLRNFPHFVIAVKHENPDGTFFVLRATIDTNRLNELISAMNIHPSSDAFIVNEKGVLQTPSRYYGRILERFPLHVPTDISHTQMFESNDPQGKPLLLGFTKVEGAPFVLVAVKRPEVILERWGLLRINIILLEIFSIIAILVVTWKYSTNLVNRVYEADLKRAAILHEIEYTNKLASIGRLAAGVAHEINNPLAIINEKAGLLKDLIGARDHSPERERFLKTVDSILGSVKRVSAITHRLLGFARHFSVKVETLDLELLIQEVLGFLGKEAEYRNVTIDTHVEPGLPTIQSDRGQLQQVFLNIINNALGGVADGGRIDISLLSAPPERLAVRVADNGVGIPPENLKRIFEPFFTTKGERGTGLGLSITYGIVQKLGGQIEVESEVGKGTTFTVYLPLPRE